MSIVRNVTTTGKARQGWLPDEINKGRMDCSYGLLAVIGFINFLLYLLCLAVRVKGRKKGQGGEYG